MKLMGMNTGWRVVRIQRDGGAESLPLEQRMCFLYTGICGFTFLWARECNRVKTEQQKWPEEIENADV